MARDVPRDWMWSEACEMLARAERMHRELFRPSTQQAQLPAWEPPVDILETEFEVLVLVALPGVDPDDAQALIEDGDLVIAGTRLVPEQLHTATIQCQVGLPHRRTANQRAITDTARSMATNHELQMQRASWSHIGMLVW